MNLLEGPCQGVGWPQQRAIMKSTHSADHHLRRTVIWIVALDLFVFSATAMASPTVSLGHYFVAKNASQSSLLPVSDTGSAVSEDIEGMTFTLQIGAGTGSTPSISSLDFLTNTVWTNQVSANGIVSAAGSGPQFKSYTLITDNAGDYINANGTLATVTWNAANALPGDYAVKLTATKDPGSDTQFTSGLGNPVPAAFGDGTLTVVLPGDFNRDNHVNASDLAAMMNALSDLNAYKSAKGLDATGLLAIGDINGDSKVTNADLQSLISLLRTGSGSNTAIPEPPALSLFTIGSLILLISSYLRHRSLLPKS